MAAVPALWRRPWATPRRPRRRRLLGGLRAVAGRLRVREVRADDLRHPARPDRERQGLPRGHAHAVEPPGLARRAAEPGVRLPLPAGARTSPAPTRRGVAGGCPSALWSVLVLVAGLRGAAPGGPRHRCSRPWGAAVAGLFYGLSPRIVAEIGRAQRGDAADRRHPWALLPIVHAATGRRATGRRPAVGRGLRVQRWRERHRDPRPAADRRDLRGLDGARRRGRCGGPSCCGGAALVAAVSIWWLVSLLRLARYSPPFFDYVEDAQTTTTTTGFAPSMRGASNWVNYIVVGDSAWWPAGYDVSLNPGWCSPRAGGGGRAGRSGPATAALSRRRCWSAAASGSPACRSRTRGARRPAEPGLRRPAGRALAPFRNVQKVDPSAACPSRVGLAAMVEELVTAADGPGCALAARARRAGGCISRRCWYVGLAAMSWPIMTATCGLRAGRIPDYWTAAADFLDEAGGRRRAPGSCPAPGSASRPGAGPWRSRCR